MKNCWSIGHPVRLTKKERNKTEKISIDYNHITDGKHRIMYHSSFTRGQATFDCSPKGEEMYKKFMKLIERG